MHFLSLTSANLRIYFKTSFCFAFILAVSNVSAQTGSISGKLTKAGDVPVAQADVFLANTTINTRTDEKGFYELKSVPQGNYVLSILNSEFQPHQQNIRVRGSDQKAADIILEAKSGTINSNTSPSDPGRKKNLEQFLRTFGKRSKDIKLLNPEILNIKSDGKILEASSNDIITLQNHYLGYETKLLLKNYVKELSDDEDKIEAGPDEYEGILSYTELNGSSSDQKRWQANRLKSYQGSALHFYRSLISNDLKKQGFTMYPLVSKLNSKRASDSLINSKILFFENPATGKNRGDSLKFWKAQRELPKYNHVLYRDSVKASEVISRESEGLYVLKYPYKLYVNYTHPDAEMTAMSNNALLNFHRPVNQFSVSVELRDHLLKIDQNGNILEPGRVKYEGGWSPKLAEMLPLNYNPEKSR